MVRLPFAVAVQNLTTDEISLSANLIPIPRHLVMAFVIHSLLNDFLMPGFDTFSARFFPPASGFDSLQEITSPISFCSVMTSQVTGIDATWMEVEHKDLATMGIELKMWEP